MREAVKCCKYGGHEGSHGLTLHKLSDDVHSLN